MRAMEPGEALSTAAQIAVALAGFAGVVGAFRSGSLHEWSPLDKHRLWLLLSNALIPLFACLFGILLLTIKPTPVPIWRWCSGFSLLLMISFGLLSQQRGLGPTTIRDMGVYRYLYYMFGILSVLVGLLQIYNALVPGVFWLFYASIIFSLALGTVQFARMILLPPHQTSGTDD
jgi:hypothetical protein